MPPAPISRMSSYWLMRAPATRAPWGAGEGIVLFGSTGAPGRGLGRVEPPSWVSGAVSGAVPPALAPAFELEAWLLDGDGDGARTGGGAVGSIVGALEEGSCAVRLISAVG